MGRRVPVKSTIHKSIRVILPFVFLFLVSCATTPKQPPLTLENPYPRDEVRVDLGTIGVVSASFQPEVRFQKPKTKGAAALLGAATGAGVVAQAGAHCTGEACLGALVLMPIGAAFGSIVGVVKGVPQEKIRVQEEALNSSIANLNFQETMRERLLSVATGQTSFPVVLLELKGPTTLDEEVSYDSLQAKHIDTILEVNVRKCELRGRQYGINPPLRLLMAAGIKLIRAQDGTVLYSQNFVYEKGSDVLTFSEWGDNDARLFREDMDRAFQYLAEQIVKALTSIQAPPDSQREGITEIE